jgi:hypothetical protein
MKMERKKLDRNHIGLQFLMMLISLLAFLVLAAFAGEIVWIKDFQYFVVLLSGVFAIFAGLIALLRYYTQKQSLTFLLLGIGFLAVGILDVVQLVIDIGNFRNLFTYTPGEIYPFSSILSRGFLSLVLFSSWIFGKREGTEKELKRDEKKIMLFVLGLFSLFGGVIAYMVFSNVFEDSLWVVIIGIITLLFTLLAFIGYMFNKDWQYDNFDFWLIFSISFLLLSQIFFLPFLNLEYYNMMNLSIWAKFFAYVALLVGFLNSIYELYQKEILIQQELEKKNKLLDETKKKVEEAYLVIRKEKWDLVEGKKKEKTKKRSKGSKK